MLSAFAELPVCVRYRLPDGTETSEFPAHQSDFHHASPCTRRCLAGSSRSTTWARWPACPAAARDYVGFIEDSLGVEICMVGTGPDRERVLTSRELESVAAPRRSRYTPRSAGGAAERSQAGSASRAGSATIAVGQRSRRPTTLRGGPR